LITVTYYYRKNDPLCLEADRLLEAVAHEYPHQMVRIDIETDPTLQSVFGRDVPVIKAGPYTLQGEMTIERLRMTLGAAQDRQEHLERSGDEKFEERYRRARKISVGDRLVEWLSNHYLGLFNLIVFLFVSIPFLAPVLMETGHPLPARIIYTVYSPLCHQLTFRSWFLFGEQADYPRALAKVPGVASYESAVLNNQNVVETSVDFITVARAFIGNDQLGYKVAICERDVALYGGILLFGVVYALSGRRIKQIPWYFWLIFGLIPIGIDGFSQLPDLIPGMPAWLPMRESTPFLRTLTGGLFGSLTAWYLYPLIEETMKDSRALLTSKKEVINQTRPS
jgi:uncharacterized membrane protein